MSSSWDLSPSEQFILDDSSDSDIEEMLDDDLEQMVVILVVNEFKESCTKKRRGSIVGRLCIPRNRKRGHNMLMADYFAQVPTYPAQLFRRRYQMRRDLFVKIVEACEANSQYFTHRRNAVGTVGFSAYQKISAAMRVIAYGIPADYADEYLRIGEDTVMESVRRFAKVMIKVFGPEYLRAPNEEDTKRLMAINEKRGWPGMLGSVDCMHWTWKNCPKAWHGMYCGKSHDPTIVLEAVASENLWIWHCFFFLPGSLNDINVLHRSHIFLRLANGDAPAYNYNVNGHTYTMGYYLADVIYHSWSTFVKIIPANSITTRKQAIFAKAQEAARKDIERAFGVLQARFAIVRGPARFWDKKTLNNIMTCCVILHNMIVEDERDLNLEIFYDNVGSRVKPARNPNRIKAFLDTYRLIEDSESHTQLQLDLIEHH
jgi:hypothetical protein